MKSTLTIGLTQEPNPGLLYESPVLTRPSALSPSDHGLSYSVYYVYYVNFKVHFLAFSGAFNPVPSVLETPELWFWPKSVSKVRNDSRAQFHAPLLAAQDWLKVPRKVRPSSLTVPASPCDSSLFPLRVQLFISTSCLFLCVQNRLIASFSLCHSLRSVVWSLYLRYRVSLTSSFVCLCGSTARLISVGDLSCRKYFWID